LNLRQLLNIALGVACGLAYFLKRFIVHGDIKSENILLDEKLNPKIGDMGTVKFKCVTQRGSVTLTGPHDPGTRKWKAPEIHRGEGASHSSDMFSYGLVLWQLWARAERFGDKLGCEVSDLYSEGKEEIIPKDTPKPVARFIKGCWSKVPANRPTAEQAVELFQKEIVTLKA
jgi:serine/threonine protein kinase